MDSIVYDNLRVETLAEHAGKVVRTAPGQTTRDPPTSNPPRDCRDRQALGKPKLSGMLGGKCDQWSR